MRILFSALFTFFSAFTYSQNIAAKLNSEFQKLRCDSDLKHGIVSLYIVESKTGKVIFKQNEQLGLPAGSAQKVITSGAAFELLGRSYTYKTSFGYTGTIINNTLNGNIIIKGSGDPALGSNRYFSTAKEKIFSQIKTALKQKGITAINGLVYADDDLWKGEIIPDHWTWQDIGNYYGAGASALNWRENQYDIILKSGKNIGDSVSIVKTQPEYIPGLTIRSEVISAVKGSGDNTYIYLPLKEKHGFIRGTIPVNENNFSVSGALPNAAKQLCSELSAALHINYYPDSVIKIVSPEIFYTHTSPVLDSINYWFLKKSINLYGEALVKTIGYEKAKYGSTDTGINFIKDFWSKRGIEKDALRMYDGSGLSPENRITTHALVTVMQFSKKQKWFSSFYNALPEINNIKMKSGTIGGTLAYTGYCKSAEGKEYTFAIIVHNYEGTSAAMRQKMWRLLDILK